MSIEQATLRDKQTSNQKKKKKKCGQTKYKRDNKSQHVWSTSTTNLDFILDVVQFSKTFGRTLAL